ERHYRVPRADPRPCLPVRVPGSPAPGPTGVEAPATEAPPGTERALRGAARWTSWTSHHAEEGLSAEITDARSGSRLDARAAKERLSAPIIAARSGSRMDARAAKTLAYPGDGRKTATARLKAA